MKRLIALVPLMALAACVARDPDFKPPQPMTGRATALPGAAESSTPSPRAGFAHDKALARGVKFLLETQRPDGSWGAALPERPADIYLGGLNSLQAFHNASTALCCMALMHQRSAETDAALVRGVRFLCDGPEAKRVRGDTFYSIWAHAYVIEALSRGYRDARLAELRPAMLKRIEFESELLWGLQGLDGGFGYYDFGYALARPSGSISTSFTTACALVALKAASEAGLEGKARETMLAVDYLERQRIPNGAYFYSTGHQFSPLHYPNMVRGSLGRSQSCDHALVAWGRKLSSRDIEGQLETFFREHVFIEIGRGRQYPHEAWYATAPYYYYFGHYYAARNLFHVSAEARPGHARKLADIIAAGQYDDGSFWDYPLYGYTKAYGTGYGVLILSLCREAGVEDESARVER